MSAADIPTYNFSDVDHPYNRDERNYLPGSIQEREICFNYDEDATSPHNAECIRIMAEHSKSNSSAYVAGAAEAVALVSVQALTARYVKKYNYIRGIVNNTAGRKISPTLVFANRGRGVRHDSFSILEHLLTPVHRSLSSENASARRMTHRTG